MAYRSSSLRPTGQSSNSAMKTHGGTTLAGAGAYISIPRPTPPRPNLQVGSGSNTEKRRSTLNTQSQLSRHNPVLVGQNVISPTKPQPNRYEEARSRTGTRGNPGLSYDYTGKTIRTDPRYGRVTGENEKPNKKTIPTEPEKPKVMNSVDSVTRINVAGAVTRGHHDLKPEERLPVKPTPLSSIQADSTGHSQLQEEKKTLKPSYHNLIMSQEEIERKSHEAKLKAIQAAEKPEDTSVTMKSVPSIPASPIKRQDSSQSVPKPQISTQPFITPKKDSPDSFASQSTAETVTRPPSARNFSTIGRATLTSVAEEQRFVGLRNFGNVCFMNAIMQCLFFTPHIEEALQGVGKEGSKTQGELLRAVKELLTDMKQARQSALSVMKIKGIISVVAPQFRDYDQHDAQEFLRVLLDALHEELNRANQTQKTQKLARVLEGTQKLEDLAEIWWQDSLRRDSSGVTDLFQGQLVNILTCSSCQNRSYTFEVFLDLSLPIPVTERSRYSSVGCSLQQCFEEFTTEREIEGVKCKRCGPQVCRARMMVYRYPKVLALHLKRFAMLQNFEGKINAPVSCPSSKLDLSKYALRSGSAVYDLYAIAHHLGDIDYGHYYA